MDDYNLYLKERERADVLQKAIEKNGKKMQVIKAVEELSELSVVLANYLNGNERFDNIAEEVADVEIMTEQLKMMFNLSDDVERWKWYKVSRLNDRLKMK